MVLVFALSLLSAIVVSPLAASALSTDRPGCKCTSDQSCWPSDSQWNTLSANLSQPVFDVVPPGIYCHDPHFDAALCAAAQDNAFNLLWITDQPGAEINDNWEFNATANCFIFGNRTTPCGQGRVPDKGVNATSVTDVQAALRFAGQYNLKVHVKNTGHDFLGRGLGPGSLMIWTHEWKQLNFSSNYVLTSGQTTNVPAITVTPGVQWYEAYQFAADNHVTIAGGVGAQASVGAGGGWPLGGGHNILSPTINLGADNVLEVSVVLPNGTFAIANEFQHPDLFFALRGGGGPTFGIATAVTYKVYPQFPLYASFFEATTNSSDAYVALLDSWNTALPSLADAGWSGYYPFMNGSYLALMYLLPNGTTETGNATLGVWIKEAQSIPGVTIKTDATATYPNYNEWLVANVLDPVNVVGFNYTAGREGMGEATASWLVPRSVFEDKTQAHLLSEAMLKTTTGIGQHVAGGVVASHPVDSNALHPAWRDTLVDIGVFNGWNDGISNEEIAAIRQNLTDTLAPYRALTTENPAQYLNEADINVSNFTQANWGAHYPRLLAFKKEIDPNNVLLVLQGVGSENWDDEQICPL